MSRFLRGTSPLADLEPLPEGVKRRSSEFIDIVIADPSEVAELEHEAARGIFRARQHEAFIEVKWYPRAASRREAISLTSRASRCSHSATA